MFNLKIRWPFTSDPCPIPPTVPPAMDPKKAFKELLAWANSQDPDTIEFTIQNIDFEVADEMDEKLVSKGFKTRFGWSGIDRVATFKIPVKIHELPRSWLVRQTSLIDQHLEAVAPCGKPSVVPKGSPRIILGDVGGCGSTVKPTWDPKIKPVNTSQTSPSTYQPDGTLYLQYQDPASKLPINIGTMPRVVLQICYNQAIEGTLDRSCDFLYNSPGNNIHGVIICEMVYLRPEKQGFRARMSLWVRHPRGDFSFDFPSAPCRLQGQEAHNFPYPREMDETATITSSHKSDTSLDNSDFYHHGRDPDGRYPIWNQTGWKVILDETDPKDGDGWRNDFDFVLNFYNLVRVCDSKEFPLLPVEAREIKLDMKWLRKQLQADLRSIRGEVQVERAVRVNIEYPMALVSPDVRRLLKKKLAATKVKSGSETAESLTPPL
ncbi:unnamed protein product [Rhizoctonia solani]|uniref:Uncharacterized protein n=1 Tax=Rhizoctonia solani TaxID=456999 RepID=A0A8H3AYM1_9AGAM|nr:unnamed protein product [Rhizoctonia solani]